MKYKVLSLNPPYGSLIAACWAHPALGKHIETRDWSTSYRGPLLIHQTKGLGSELEDESDLHDLCYSRPFRATLAAMGYHYANELPRGAIVARVELRDCRIIGQELNGDATIAADDMLSWTPILEPERSFGDYTPGRFAWLLADIRALPEPIAARGMPGLWEWEGELEL